MKYEKKNKICTHCNSIRQLKSFEGDSEVCNFCVKKNSRKKECPNCLIVKGHIAFNMGHEHCNQCETRNGKKATCVACNTRKLTAYMVDGVCHPCQLAAKHAAKQRNLRRYVARKLRFPNGSVIQRVSYSHRRALNEALGVDGRQICPLCNILKNKDDFYQCNPYSCRECFLKVMKTSQAKGVQNLRRCYIAAQLRQRKISKDSGMTFYKSDGYSDKDLEIMETQREKLRKDREVKSKLIKKATRV